MQRIPLAQFHEHVVVETFGRQTLNDGDFFLLFCLLHNFRINLKQEGLIEETDAIEVAALTQRGAGAVLAALWKAEKGAEKSVLGGKPAPETDYAHWYWKWNREWGGYGHFEDLQIAESARLMDLKKQLEDHPFIAEILPEE